MQSYENAGNQHDKKGNYLVAVYAICKNEESFVERWMDSMCEADIVVVTDTGSTDNTVKRLQEHGAIVYVDKVSPWRFDVARNISLEHVPKDVDICVCTDLDEVLTKGWREKLEKAWTPEAKTGNYLYNWSLRADGTPYVQFTYFKVHSREGFRWKYPVHECLEYYGSSPHSTVFIDGIVLNHYPDPTKSRGSYLPLLELGAKEMPTDTRMAYYLGREYMYSAKWEQCIAELMRYLELPSSNWVEERCAAMRWIARSYHKLLNDEQAYRWYFRAIAQAPKMRDAYVEFAKLGYELSDWHLVHCMVEQALKIQKQSNCFVNMGYAWDHTPNDLGAIACYRLGMYKRSLEHARAAIEHRPQDKRLQENLRLIETKS